jgi:Uma2 family endonuclease
LATADRVRLDLKHKMKRYEASGVKEYWIVDPVEKSIEVYENENGQFRLFSHAHQEGSVKSNLLAGFEVALASAFA